MEDNKIVRVKLLKMRLSILSALKYGSYNGNFIAFIKDFIFD